MTITPEQARAELARRKLARQQESSQSPENEKGFSGIGKDIETSWENFPQALADMVSSIPGGLKKVARYATTNDPYRALETMGNLGAGVVESGAGLLSAPQIAERYLAEKFPSFQKIVQGGMKPDSNLNDPTFFEALMNFEKQHGLSPINEDEAAVRNLGGLVGGGKALSELPGMFSRLTALSGEQAGRGGDPLHAAILGIGGHLIPKIPFSKVKDIPVKKIPEMATQGVASAIESAADLGAKTPIIGGAAQPTMGALASYLKHISVSPEELAKRKLMGDIDPNAIPEMLERDKAGKRLGLTYLTPSELLNDPFESVKQGDIGRTKGGSKLLYKQGEIREGSEEGAINRLIDAIHTDKLEPAKKLAYETTMQSDVTPEFVEKQMKRPVIQKAIKAVESDAAYKQSLQEELGIELGDVKPISFMYWDMIKRVLGDMEENAKETGRPTTKSGIYTDTRKSMVKEMDAIQPEYKVARKIAERKFTKQKIEDVFDKKAKTFNNFDSYLKSAKNYNKLMGKLESFPEAQQILKDIKLFSGKMIPNNPTVRAAAALKRTGMSDARNALEAKKRALDEKYGQEHDVAAVKLMTHPDFMKELIEHLKSQGKSI